MKTDEAAELGVFCGLATGPVFLRSLLLATIYTTPPFRRVSTTPLASIITGFTWPLNTSVRGNRCAAAVVIEDFTSEIATLVVRISRRHSRSAGTGHARLTPDSARWMFRAGCRIEVTS
jgi:hypothetical protein